LSRSLVKSFRIITAIAFVTFGALWIRSYWYEDGVQIVLRMPSIRLEVFSASGRIYIVAWDLSYFVPAEETPPRFSAHAYSLPAEFGMFGHSEARFTDDPTSTLWLEFGSFEAGRSMLIPFYVQIPTVWLILVIIAIMGYSFWRPYRSGEVTGK
jgi:hypothetical protein